MLLNTKKIVTITDANQNFSKVARLVDEEKSVVILKNNRPKYVLIEYEEFAKEAKSEEDKFYDIANRVLEDNIEAFRELSK
ncbi:MAG: type II toxin-antitoxin system Phd/YefM family antitoxin [Ruminiclostridium sp.]|nr:type II toxin-antitoxin system Phd/YefM family antitoxin [Ruminiclostridium sp.]